MKPSIFTIRFLWLTGFMLQAFSLMVSFRPVYDFLGAYLPGESFRLFFTIAALVFIECGVFAFLNSALGNLPDFTERVAIRGFAVLFVCLSAFLTYHGSATIAVSNLEALPLLEAPADLARIQGQIEADRQRLKQISTFQAQRKNNWLTRTEQTEMALMQERIQRNDQLLTESNQKLTVQNEAIAAQNQQREKEQANLHHNFGFLTQLFLVMVFLARDILQRNHLKKEGYHERGGIVHQYGGEMNSYTKHPAEIDPENFETLPKPEGKLKGNSLDINISAPVLQKVAQLTLEGMTTTEIAEQLGIVKSTVSKARYQVAQQMVTSGQASILEASEKFNINSDKLTQKLNGHARI
jgi:adenosyl cobinamide kinase/adenosyl cobinamide phosphate guanylyltransferase